MLKRHGVILTKILIMLTFIFPLKELPAISIGNLTFSLPSESNYVSKRITNNNKSARLYRVSVNKIDSPGINETISRSVDGELLFAPRQLTLQAGESELFKFYYHGPQDNRERYYRVSFTEIPTFTNSIQNSSGAYISMAPVIIMDSILVVRPRKVKFSWSYNRKDGSLSNTGNTWFKLLIKPGCNSKEEEGDAWYLRPGDIIHESALRKEGNHYIIFNEKFIKLTKDCISQ
ncbi:fimbria/pilus periplasmic chaperone [Klebsiella aerogenes]